MAENTQADVKKLTFERAIEELESIVKRLEDGKVPLEESVAIYERGEALKRRCEELLRQAEARVDKITTERPARSPGPSRSTCSDRPEVRPDRRGEAHQSEHQANFARARHRWAKCRAELALGALPGLI